MLCQVGKLHGINGISNLYIKCLLLAFLAQALNPNLSKITQCQAVTISKTIWCQAVRYERTREQNVYTSNAESFEVTGAKTGRLANSAIPSMQRQLNSYVQRKV